MALLDSIKVMLGRQPGRRPSDRSMDPAARAIHQSKKGGEGKKERVAAIKAERDLHRSHKWRNRRWLRSSSSTCCSCCRSSLTCS